MLEYGYKRSINAGTLASKILVQSIHASEWLRELIMKIRDYYVTWQLIIYLDFIKIAILMGN